MPPSLDARRETSATAYATESRHLPQKRPASPTLAERDTQQAHPLRSAVYCCAASSIRTGGISARQYPRCGGPCAAQPSLPDAVGAGHGLFRRHGALRPGDAFARAARIPRRHARGEHIRLFHVGDRQSIRRTAHKPAGAVGEVDGHRAYRGVHHHRRAFHREPGAFAAGAFRHVRAVPGHHRVHHVRCRLRGKACGRCHGPALQRTSPTGAPQADSPQNKGGAQ